MQVQEGDDERDGDDNATTATNDEGNSEKGADGDQDGERAAERDGEDNATTATNDEGIVSDTETNRPQRTRDHNDIYQDIYQAGIKGAVKKPGRGRGRR